MSPQLVASQVSGRQAGKPGALGKVLNPRLTTKTGSQNIEAATEGAGRVVSLQILQSSSANHIDAFQPCGGQAMANASKSSLRVTLFQGSKSLPQLGSELRAGGPA